MAKIISSRYTSTCRKCEKPYARGELIAWESRGIAFHVACCPYPIDNPEVVMDPLGPVVKLGERIGNALAAMAKRYGTGPEVQQALKRGIEAALRRAGVSNDVNVPEYH